MDWAITWGGWYEDVSIRTSGQASLEGLNAFIQEGLGDSRWRPGMRVLLDHRELTFGSLTTRELRTQAASVVAEKDRLGGAHVAVVLAATVDYGIVRMMQAFSDNWSEGAVIDQNLFYTLHDARTWLSQFPPPTT